MNELCQSTLDKETGDYTQNKEEKEKLTDFHNLIFPYKPMHCVPYKSLQEAEQLKAVTPLLSALQTAQFACRLIYI